MARFSIPTTKIQQKKAEVKTSAKSSTKTSKSSTISGGLIHISDKILGVGSRKPTVFSGSGFMDVSAPAPEQIVEFGGGIRRVAYSRTRQGIDLAQREFVFFFHK